MGQIAVLLPFICFLAYPSGSLQQDPAVENKENLKFHVHLVARNFGNEWRCSGALIKPTWILTAASCLEQAERVFISIGNDWNITVDGSSWVIHHGYSPVMHSHNLALIKTPKPAPAQPIEIFIPRPLSMEPNSTFVRVGYRRVKPQAAHILSRNLQSARVRSVEMSQCENLFGRDMSGVRVFCYRAVDRADHPLCVGEVGAPLIVLSDQFEKGLVGIYSFAPSEKCFLDLPAVYTNVYVYTKWIEMAIRSYDATGGSMTAEPIPNENPESGSATVQPQDEDTVDGNTRRYDDTTEARTNISSTPDYENNSQGHQSSTPEYQNDSSTNIYDSNGDGNVHQGYQNNSTQQKFCSPGQENGSPWQQNDSSGHRNGSQVNQNGSQVHQNSSQGQHNGHQGYENGCQEQQSSGQGYQTDSRGGQNVRQESQSSGQGYQNGSQGHQSENKVYQNRANSVQSDTQGCQNSQFTLPGSISVYPLSSVGGNTNLKINISVNIENV